MGSSVPPLRELPSTSGSCGKQVRSIALRDSRLRAVASATSRSARHPDRRAAPAYFSETQYRATLSREFNQLEPENAMKFGPIHPGPTTDDFDPADALVNFAKANNMAVRGHT